MFRKLLLQEIDAKFKHVDKKNNKETDDNGDEQEKHEATLSTLNTNNSICNGITFSRRELEGKSRDDLKAILKSLNGSVRGLKAELIDRILELQSNAVQSDNDEIKEIHEYTNEILRTVCKNVGMAVHGKKDDIVARLLWKNINKNNIKDYIKSDNLANNGDKSEPINSETDEDDMINSDMEEDNLINSDTDAEDEISIDNEEEDPKSKHEDKKNNEETVDNDNGDAPEKHKVTLSTLNKNNVICNEDAQDLTNYIETGDIEEMKFDIQNVKNEFKDIKIEVEYAEEDNGKENDYNIHNVETNLLSKEVNNDPGYDTKLEIKTVLEKKCRKIKERLLKIFENESNKKEIIKVALKMMNGINDLRKESICIFDNIQETEEVTQILDDIKKECEDLIRKKLEYIYSNENFIPVLDVGKFNQIKRFSENEYAIENESGEVTSQNFDEEGNVEGNAENEKSFEDLDNIYKKISQKKKRAKTKRVQNIIQRKRDGEKYKSRRETKLLEKKDKIYLEIEENFDFSGDPEMKYRLGNKSLSKDELNKLRVKLKNKKYYEEKYQSRREKKSLEKKDKIYLEIEENFDFSGDPEMKYRLGKKSLSKEELKKLKVKLKNKKYYQRNIVSEEKRDLLRKKYREQKRLYRENQTEEKKDLQKMKNKIRKRTLRNKQMQEHIKELKMRELIGIKQEHKRQIDIIEGATESNCFQVNIDNYDDIMNINNEGEVYEETVEHLNDETNESQENEMTDNEDKDDEASTQHFDFVEIESQKNNEINEEEQIHSETGEKPFQCSICTKLFESTGELTAHKQSHHEEKPFRCFRCPKAFRASGLLTTHKRSHSGEKPFICLLCPKVFGRFSSLTRHKLTHSDEKQFQCSICLKGFNTSDNLTQHKRSHSADRSFKCLLCPKAFKSNGDLTTHKRFHSGEKPFRCSLCPEAFTWSGDLTRHKQKQNHTE